MPHQFTDAFTGSGQTTRRVARPHPTLAPVEPPPITSLPGNTLGPTLNATQGGAAPVFSESGSEGVLPTLSGTNNRLNNEIIPQLESGVPLTQEQQAFFSGQQQNDIVKTFLGNASTNVKLLGENAALAGAVQDSQNAGITNPTGLSVGAQQASVTSEFIDAFVDLQALITSDNLESILTNLPKLEQLNLDVAKIIGPQLAQLDQQTATNLVSRLGKGFADIESQLRPEDSAVRSAIQAGAQRDLDQGIQLDPAIQREVEQQRRGQQAGQGTLFGTSAIADESFDKLDAGLQQQDRSRNAAAGVLNLNAQTQLDPISTILGRSFTRDRADNNLSPALSGFAGNTFNQVSNFASTPFNLNQKDIAQTNALNAAASGSGGSTGGGVLGALSGGATGFQTGKNFSSEFGKAGNFLKGIFG